MNTIKYLFPLFLLILITSCQNDDEVADPDPEGGVDLTDTPYNPVPYDLDVPSGFFQMEVPVDNALTEDGVNLGRHLFYDPILSADSTMSCSTCHLPSGSFTDNLAVSPGIDGVSGQRSSMSLLNVGFYESGLFWDGRVSSLEEQALLPVEDPIELHNTWPNLIDKLKAHPDYPIMFRKAFGIESVEGIDKVLAAKAIAQFERIMVSSGKSRYEIVTKPTPGQFLTTEQEEGRKLFFFEEATGINHPGCSHCHSGSLLTTNAYENNGSQAAATLDDFADKGHGVVTGNPTDNGKFRVPTLRNIELTAPYMHNGQFNTLEEVVDHYATGGMQSPNVSTLLIPFTLTDEEKAQLVAFLKTFTDMEFVNNPDLQNPFVE